MMIEYENTLEDIVAFNQYHLATSPSFNRAARLWSLVAILGAGAVILYRSGSWVWGLIAVGLGWLVTLWRPERRLVARMSGKAIREFLAEGKNDSILGCRRVVLSEETFNEVSDTGTQAVRYAALGRIVETPEYIFVYVSAVQAAVIPKRGQPAEMIEHFVGELRRRVLV